MRSIAGEEEHPHIVCIFAGRSLKKRLRGEKSSYFPGLLLSKDIPPPPGFLSLGGGTYERSFLLPVLHQYCSSPPLLSPLNG